MKIINCACPKCGKQTTEYDNDKWTCLHCGNKFVIKPEAETHINNNNFTDIHSDALFDIDPNGTEPSSSFTDLYSLTGTEAKKSLNMLLGGKDISGGWVFIIFGIPITAAALFLSSIGGSVTGGILFLIGYFFIYIKNFNIEHAESRIYSELKTTEIHYKNTYKCPHCNAVIKETSIDYDELQRFILNFAMGQNKFENNSESTEALGLYMPTPENGFEHCVSCGKQFYVFNNKLCKIKRA